MFKFLAPLAAVVCLGQSVAADSLSGSYLAASQANLRNDYEAAAQFYTQALARDADNPYLLQNALLSFVGKGDVKRGIEIAKQLQDMDVKSQIGMLVLIASHLNDGDFDAAKAILDEEGPRLSPLLSGLMSGWVSLGQGNMTAASAAFDKMEQPEILQLLGQYHKALALAVVGDFEGADTIIQGEDGANLRLNRGSLIAHAQIMSQIEKTDEAVELLSAAVRGGSDQELMELRDAIKADGAVPFTYLTSAKQGAAEVFSTLAGVLQSDQGDRFGLVYARLAQFLRPDNTEGHLLAAEMLRDQNQFDLAAKAYARVDAKSPMFYNAEVGRAEALVEADRRDAAVEVLRGLVRSHGDIPNVHMSLGDALRGGERWEEAEEAYNTAVDMLPEFAPNHWFLFYARGITHERQKLWDDAEADFRKSLELSPAQPLTLNYLGYSLIERREKMDEALGMIEKAVEGRPNSGFIADSLGWGRYRLGMYEEAVAPMEKAVELQPVDPVINDHLGDVLWKVGRKIEAVFQWKRALSFDPEEADAERIRQKLELGLDAVLEAEEKIQTNDN